MNNMVRVNLLLFYPDGIPTAGISTDPDASFLEFLNDCLAAATVSKATV